MQPTKFCPIGTLLDVGNAPSKIFIALRLAGPILRTLNPLIGRMNLHSYLVMALALSTFTADGDNRPIGKTFTTRSEVVARHGMVATSQPLAVQAGIDILKAGGNAIDAAIACNAVMGLVEPTGNGIGGDLFAIVWDGKQRKLQGLNASGRSPHLLTLDYFKKQGLESIPQAGPLPVSVPGCVDGWFELHQRFGSLPMKQILKPAIRYAEEGFPVSEVIAAGWKGGKKFSEWPGFDETFMPGGEAPKKGEIFRNPGLAKTLKQLAKKGRDEFYRGSIARKIAKYMQKHGGFITEQDLADHRSEWVQPVSANYRGYDVWELPPNTQGIAALQILNLLEGFDIKSMGFGSRDYIHHFVEAKKLAFEDRAKYYSDPDFNELPIQELISKNYAAERRKLIGDKPADTYNAGNPSLRDGDTIFLTTADRHGNMVSLIQSNFRGFGSGMTPPGLGFCLQNRGELFTLDPEHRNVYAPHKRPFHTIIPAFITKDGVPFMTLGLMGGDMQPQGHAQIVVNIVDFGMNLQEAGDAPRIRHGGSSSPTGEMMKDGGEVYLEYGFSPEVERDLQKLGHKISRTSVGSFGGYQAIRWDPKNKVYLGASESRKDGQASGY